MKFVLILSSENDVESDLFEAALNCQMMESVRINREDAIEQFFFDVRKEIVSFLCEGQEVILSADNVDVVFWRGEGLNQKIQRSRGEGLDVYLSSYYEGDWRVIVEAVEFLLSKNALFIGSPDYERRGNKIIDIIRANDVGLLIPDSLLCTSQFDLDSFFGEKDKIFKHHGKRIRVMNESICIASSNTRSFSKESSNNTIPMEYGVTLFQENVMKHFEVKALFLFGEIISVGLFSQFNDGDCAIDYRLKMSDDFLRLARVEIPEEVNNKIKTLVGLYGMNVCVLDFIVDNDGRFVFLEINPTGRFNWIAILAKFDPYGTILKNINKYRCYGKEMFMRKDEGEQKCKLDLSLCSI